MIKLTDRLGREWLIEITATGEKMVRAKLGIKLYDLVDNNFAGFEQLFKDPGQIIDILFVLCEGQNGSPSDVEFGKGFTGATLEKAGDAFLAAFVDFFPDRRIAGVLPEIFKKAGQAKDLATAELISRLEQTTPESLVKILRKKSGGSRASSASTPAPLASDN